MIAHQLERGGPSAGYKTNEIIGRHFSIFYSSEDNAGGKLPVLPCSNFESAPFSDNVAQRPVAWVLTSANVFRVSCERYSSQMRLQPMHRWSKYWVRERPLRKTLPSHCSGYKSLTSNRGGREFLMHLYYWATNTRCWRVPMRPTNNSG